MEEDEAIDYLFTLLKTQGVACATVNDGHILLFKREKLQQLLDQAAGKEELMIFIKRPDFKN